MQRNKNSNAFLKLVIFLILIIILAMIAGIRHIKLRQKTIKIEYAPYIYKAKALAKMARKNNKDVTVVLNDDVGLWDEKGINKIELVQDLTLGGADESDTNLVFYRPFVKSDSKGNIYVGEVLDGVIKKFDKNGNYLKTIGNKGQGPEEIFSYFDFIIDKQDIIHVYDLGNQRISLFSDDGIFLSSVQIDKSFSGAFTFLWNESDYYFSYLDLESDKVIHKYNNKGHYINSFGESIIFTKKIPQHFINTSQNVAFGILASYDNNLYFSRSNPYEIHVYNFAGELKKKIFRKNNFMKPYNVKIFMDRIGSSHITRSDFVFVWNDYIINSLFMPDKKNIGGILDVFNLSGQLLTSIIVKDNICFYSGDLKGYLYGIKDIWEIPKVVRLKIKIK